MASRAPAPTERIITNDGPGIQRGPGSNIAIQYANSPNVLDSSGVNGVGQMILLNTNVSIPANLNGGVAGRGTFLGLCTGTLINPRTVITAAHCVYNDLVGLTPTGAEIDVPRNPAEYGSNTGTDHVPISFGFSPTNRCTGTATNPGNGCLRNTGPYEAWRDSGFQSVEGKFIYNGNQVWYDQSANPLVAGGEFGRKDVAIVTLDRHVSNVPTWTLLFSPLTGSTHATITGYGSAGVGTPGIGDLAGIDYRRRSAENMIDALMSSADWAHNPLIGGPNFHGFDFYAHSLYWTDFDDPAYDPQNPEIPDNSGFLVDGDPADLNWNFNGLGGGALPHEGTTGGGDSGGPLIVDQTFRNPDGSFKPVVAGVLTGGWSFNGGIGTYGEFSVYPPLFLYWQEIVANNPYKYVSAKAGNGDWFDPAHWVQDMDPNYAVIGPDGQLMNSLPNVPQIAQDSNAGRFGTVCAFEIPSLCNTAPTSAYPTGTGNFIVTAGGPGTTNFVPNNVEPVNSLTAGATVKARYYDVTLREAGKTTLSSNATIDKLTLDGAAHLDIGASGNLNVWAEFNQLGGWTNIDGALKTDEAMALSGILSGRGTFDPTFLTVVGAVVAPGGGDKVGTFTIKSDTILASASTLFIDAMRGAADRLIIAGDADGLGSLTLSQNGTTGAKPSIVFNKVTDGPAPRAGDSFTIVSAAGGVSGTFGNAYTFQGVLRPELTYNGTTITALLRAGSLVTVLDGQNATAIAFANALDQLRTGFYDKLYNLYGNVDWMNGVQLNATFNALSPASMVGETQLLQDRQSRQLFGTVSDRLSLLGTGLASGLSFSGTATPMMRGNSNASPQAILGLSSSGRSVAVPIGGGLSGFVSMGTDGVRSSYGDSRGFDGGQHGHYYSSGIEAPFGALRVGTAVGYAESVSQVGIDRARSKLSQAAAYASVPLGGNAYVGGIVTAEQARSTSNRFATDTVSNFRLTGATHSSRYTATAEAGFRSAIGRGLAVNPRAQLGYSRYALDGFREQGGETAFLLNGLKMNRLEARLGAKLDGSAHIAGWLVSPRLQADYVRLVSGGRDGLNVSFAAAPDYAFALPLTNGASGWAELKGGVSMSRGAFSLGLSGQATAGDAPISDQRGLVSLGIKF